MPVQKDFPKALFEEIRKKRPSRLLDVKTANQLYGKVPTDAKNYLGMKLMSKRQHNDTEIKITAFEPLRGILPSVKEGTTVPILSKLGKKSTKLFTAKFGSSYSFNESELLAVAKAESAHSDDPIIANTALDIVNAIGDLKKLEKQTLEVYFWQGCLGAMNVMQKDNGEITSNVIPTNVIQSAALSSTLKWNTDPVTSQADPAKDLRAMKREFAFTGAILRKVYMNQNTFDAMIECASVRDRFIKTTTDLETGTESIKLGGVEASVYDQGYLDDSGAAQFFIPDGHLIGIADAVGMRQSPVELYECLNVEATNPDSLQITTVFGAYIDVTGTRNPVSKTVTLTSYTLPVFINPKLIVFKKVF